MEVTHTLRSSKAASYFGFAGLNDPFKLLQGMSEYEIAHMYAGYVAARVIGLWLFRGWRELSDRLFLP